MRAHCWCAHYFNLEHTNHVFTVHWLCVYSTLTIELGGHRTLTKVAIPHHCLRLMVFAHLVATAHQQNNLEPLHTSLCTQWLQHTILWFSGYCTPH